MTKSDEPDAPGLRRIASWETDPRYSPNPTNGIVEVTCPNCSKVYHAHCTHLGTAFDCKACGVRFVGKTNEAGVQKITVHYWGRALALVRWYGIAIILTIVLMAFWLLMETDRIHFDMLDLLRTLRR